MNLFDIINILGFSLTALSLGLIFYFRNKVKYPGELKFVRWSLISLFDSYVKNLSDLSINLNNKPISKDVFHLNASIVNTGFKDITSEMVKNPISLELGKNFQWLEANISESSKNIVSNYKVDNEKVSINFDLLRRNEYLSINGLVQCIQLNEDENNTSLKSTFLSALKIKSRIVDTSDITILNGSEIKRYKFWKHFGAVSFLLAILLLFSKLSIDSINKVFFTSEETKISYNYLLSTDSLSWEEYKLSFSKENFVQLTNVKNDSTSEVHLSNFLTIYNFKSKKIESYSEVGSKYYIGSIIILLLFTLFVFGLYNLNKTYLNERKLNKIFPKQYFNE